jgi:hypothetical protein
MHDTYLGRDENRRNPPAFVIRQTSGVTSLSAQFMHETRMATGLNLANTAFCSLWTTNRNLRNLFTQFSDIPLLLFSLPFLETRHKIQAC